MVEGETTTTIVGNQTTTITTTIPQTTTIGVTTIPESSTTIPEETPTEIKTWYIILIVLIFVMITIVIGYFKYKKKLMDIEFEQLKEKWKKIYFFNNQS
ncbi:MAG: hypothetical protein QMD36_03065 [Candidatus Aenigmarchaeota archaeon]|nr:hypothetical protein [Candidatus Aenigmarchaeota archaeon]